MAFKTGNRSCLSVMLGGRIVVYPKACLAGEYARAYRIGGSLASEDVLYAPSPIGLPPPLSFFLFLARSIAIRRASKPAEDPRRSLVGSRMDTTAARLRSGQAPSPIDLRNLFSTRSSSRSLSRSPSLSSEEKEDILDSSGMPGPARRRGKGASLLSFMQITKASFFLARSLDRQDLFRKDSSAEKNSPRRDE